MLRGGGGGKTKGGAGAKRSGRFVPGISGVRGDMLKGREAPVAVQRQKAERRCEARARASGVGARRPPGGDSDGRAARSRRRMAWPGPWTALVLCCSRRLVHQEGSWPAATGRRSPAAPAAPQTGQPAALSSCAAAAPSRMRARAATCARLAIDDVAGWLGTRRTVDATRRLW